MTEQEKQKRIKEMAKTLRSCYPYQQKESETFFMIMSLNLVNAGYGDTKQAVREFAEKVQYDVLNYVLKQFKPKPDDKLTNVIYSISRKIDELVKEICDK